MKRGRHLVLALIGAALFVWVIIHVGPATVLHQLKAMRYAVPILVALSLCRLLSQTFAWSTALRSEGISVDLGRLMGVRLAAQSMGYLTFLGAFLSEPMKIKLLRSPAEPAITATFLDNGVYWFTSAIVALTGCVCAALLAVHGAHYSRSVVAVALLALLLFLITRHKPVLSSLVRICGRHCPPWLKRGESIETSIRNYRLRKPAVVSRLFWFDVSCQLLMVSEVIVVVWSLRLPIHFVTILAIEGVTRALKMVSGWVPARLGADEGGAMSAFMAAGLSPVSGLALALARRIRDLMWALIGISWLVWTTRNATSHENTVTATP